MKKQEFRGENRHFKPFWCIFLAVAILLVIQISVVSAFEFDNIGRYDEPSKTFTIKNSILGIPFLQLDTVAEIKLNTATDFKVIFGDDRKVAEFTISSYEDYSNAFKKMEFFDIKKDMKEFERDFTYKYKRSLGIFDVNEYEMVCIDSGKQLGNGTILQDCHDRKLIGTHKEERFEWVEFDTSKKLPIGEITIGVFTDVPSGDKVEWIPTLFGVRINEWAGWTEDLNVDLVSYYKLDEQDTTGSGAIYDELGVNNGTNAGASNITGKINSAYYFDEDNTDSIKIDNGTGTIADITDGNLTINAWIKVETNTAQKAIVSGQCNSWGFYISAGSKIALGKICIDEKSSSDTFDIGNWNMATVTYDGSADLVTFYINGTADSGGSQAYSTTFTADLRKDIGAMVGVGGGYHFNGTIDEVGIWTRVLSASEVTQLWNNGDGTPYTDSFDNTPTVSLNTPVNNYGTTAPTIIFNCSASDDINLVNVSLLINGTIKQTNTSGINNTFYIFTETLTTGTGTYNWSCQAVDNISQSGTATARNFTYSNALAVSLNSPVNVYNSTTSNITFNGTASDDTAVVNVSLYINGVLNETDSSGLNNTFYYFTLNFDDGDYNWTYEACDATSCISATTRNISIDTTMPTINITYPMAKVNYQIYNESLNLNWTVTDNKLDSCWYNYNGTNITVTCTTNTTEINITDYTNKNVTFYANDTFGNLNSSYHEWVYKIFENYTIFSATTWDTSIETFSINVSSDGDEIVLANFIYNGTDYSTTKTGNTYVMEFNSSIAIEPLWNISFYWSFDYGGEILNSSLFYQNVSEILMGFCAGELTTQTINFTAYDEENRSRLTLFDFYGTFEYWLEDESVKKNFSVSNSSVNATLICINTNQTFYSNAVIQYEKVGRVKRNYYLVNDSFTNVSTDIDLFLLITSHATSFIIDVIDYAQFSIPDAYIYLQRYYAGTDEYETVAMALTDDSGSTIGHFEVETEDYRVIIELDGVIIYQSGSQKIFCRETPCTLTFQTEAEAGITWEDFGIIDQFEWTLDFDEVTNIWTLVYTDTSSSIGYGRLFVYYEKPDEGKITICNTTSTLLADTLTCDATGYNGTIYAKVYLSRSPEILVYLRSVIIGGLKTILGLEGLFLSMFVLLLLGLIGLWNPTVGIISVVGGMIILNFMGLASFGATTIWGVIFIALIILWELKS